MKPNPYNLLEWCEKDLLLLLSATLAAARAFEKAEKQGNELLRVAYQEQMDLRANYTRTLIRRYWEAYRDSDDESPAECCEFASLPCPHLRQLAFLLSESVSERRH